MVTTSQSVSQEITVNLQQFINYRQQYISREERKYAQLFLDSFFQAFGHLGAIEAGAEYEKAIKLLKKSINLFPKKSV
jgi:hypothetical protein